MLGFERSSIRYKSTGSNPAALLLRIRDLARTRVRYRYFRITILLRREGWPVNHKRVYRLYRNDGLSLRLKRPRRHVSAVNRERTVAASAPNALWSMDFVSDALFDGRRLRALTVVDAYMCGSVGLGTLDRLRRATPLRVSKDCWQKHSELVAKILFEADQRWNPMLINTQLRQYLADFINAYNFGRRLKTLKGLTPYEAICKQWTSEPERFRLHPIHQMPGLNT